MVAFHANPLPMSITSLRDHRHLEVNEAAVRHSGYSREEMLGHTKPELGFWVTASSSASGCSVSCTPRGGCGISR